MTINELEVASWSFVGLAFGTVVRSLVLAALCSCGVWLLRARTAELRFWLWKWALYALLALPLLLEVTPPLRNASRSISRVESAILPGGSNARATASAQPHKFQTLPVREPRNSPEVILIVPAFYLLVTAALLARLSHNRRRLGRLAERSEFIPDAGFRALAQQIWLESGAFLKPRVAVSDEVSVPVTFELDDIWILVPKSWRKWDQTKLRAVLTHEMAHVSRRDSARLLVASIATCLFWFHPLSWFLRRKLSALAEEACDEVAVTSVETPEQYAGFLIEFASDVQDRRGRLAFGITAVVLTPHIKKRIERLFADTRCMRRGKRAFAVLAFALFVPAVYLTAAARFQEPQEPADKTPWVDLEQLTSLSPGAVARLDMAVRANPEDLESRMKLLEYFSYTGQDQPFTNQLLWFIKRHPEIQSLEMAQGIYRSREWLSQESRDQIRPAWEQAMAEYPDSPRVLLNAASFLERIDPERGLEILQRAKAMDAAVGPECERKAAAIYAAAESAGLGLAGKLNTIEMSRETGEKLRTQLENSGDPALLAATGQILSELSSPRDNGAQQRRGLELIQHAIQLDPGNAKWTEALESAEAEPQRKLNYETLMKPHPPQPGIVRIGSGVADASLVSKVDPVYPPLARSARVQGSVEFSVVVGPDGKVQTIQLVRGHPLLVNAAKEAVSKLVYRPVLEDGKPIPFETEVTVPFRLPE